VSGPRNFFDVSFESGGAYLKLCPMQIRCNGQEPTGSMFFVQKTSRFAGGFNFVAIDLKLSVTLGTIFLRLGVIIFLLTGIFGGEENVLGDCYTRAG